jgi:hypothetical protein
MYKRFSLWAAAIGVLTLSCSISANAITTTHYTETWDIAGTYNISIPAGAQNLSVEIYGAGGGGSGGAGAYRGRAGARDWAVNFGNSGGGGGYVAFTGTNADIFLGKTISVTLGHGGSEGANAMVNNGTGYATAGNGTSGTDTTVSVDGNILVNKCAGATGTAPSINYQLFGTLGTSGAGGICVDGANNPIGTNGTSGRTGYRVNATDSGHATVLDNNIFTTVGGGGTTNNIVTGSSGGGVIPLDGITGNIMSALTGIPAKDGQIIVNYDLVGYDVTGTGDQASEIDISGGNLLTITGTDLDGTTSVYIGTQPCLDLQVISATTVTCRIPAASAAGPVEITLTSHGITITVGEFTFTQATIIPEVPNTSGPIVTNDDAVFIELGLASTTAFILTCGFAAYRKHKK